MMPWDIVVILRVNYRKSVFLSIGDRIGTVPATRYVETSIATSTNGPTRTMPAKTICGSWMASCVHISMLTAVRSHGLTEH